MKTLGDIGGSEIERVLRGQGLLLRVGPVNALVRSRVAGLADDISVVYADYPLIPADTFAHHSIVVAYSSFLRRFVRRNVVALSDHPSPFVPLPDNLAFVAMEMGLNWQMAMGRNHYLLFHASSVVDDAGNAVLMPGGSGSGKSTLAAGLGYSGWRFLGDEFALLNPKSGMLHAFPRPISLKNEAIDVMRAHAPGAIFSRPFHDTLKGTITYLAPPTSALVHDASPVAPKAIVFPKFMQGGEASIKSCSRAEALTRLVGASVNYWRHGEMGFNALTELCRTVPAFHIRYSNMEDGKRLVQEALICA